MKDTRLGSRAVVRDLSRRDRRLAPIVRATVDAGRGSRANRLLDADRLGRTVAPVRRPVADHDQGDRPVVAEEVGCTR